MSVPQPAREAGPAGPSVRRSKAAPEAAPAAVIWDLRADPYVVAEFPAELVVITVAVRLSADVRSLVPGDAPAGFWGRFWDGLQDRLEAAIGDALEAGLGGSFEDARETARRMLAERFAQVTRTAA